MKHIVFFLITVSVTLSNSFAQEYNWGLERKIIMREKNVYQTKIEYYQKQRMSDSALYFLVRVNERLIKLQDYEHYFFNLKSIGDFCDETYQYEQGIDLLQKGIRLYDEVKNQLTDSVVHNLRQIYTNYFVDIASFYRRLNAMSTAHEYYKKHLQLRSQIFGEHHKHTAHAHNTLASNFLRLNLYDKSLEHYQKSIKIFTEIYGDTSSYLGQPLGNLGTLHLTQKKYSKALSYLKKALDFSVKKYGHNSGKLALRYENIGRVFVGTKLYDLGLENYTNALKLRLKDLGVKHPFVANLYHRLASLYQEQGKNGTSLKFYQKALISNMSNFNDTINIYALPRDIYGTFDKPILLKTLVSKGILLNQLGTEQTNLEQAYKTYQLADQLVDDMRKNLLRKSDELRLTSTVASMYEKVLQVCWRLSKYEKDKPSHLSEEGKTQVPNENLRTKQYNPYWVKAFYFAEKGKSSVLRKLATDASAKIQSNIPEVVLEQERRLNGAILYYQQQLDRFQVKKQLTKRDSIQKQRFEDQRFELRRKYDQLLRDLEEKYPDYYDLKHNSYVASVADVQRRLDAKTALIEYVITEKQLFSFVITREGFQVYEQAIDREKLKKEITRWLNNIQGGSDDAYLPRGYRFFKQFIQPLQAHLKDKKHLLIIPDALLSRLPFEAIITQKEVPIGKPEKYPYLIRKWGVTLYPSASLALMQQQRRGVTYTHEFLGWAPVFEKNFAQQGIFRKKLNALPFTKKEVETIHQLFQEQQKNSKVIIGEEVTEGMVKELKGHYKFIHFATHGFLEDKTPALAFYPNQTKDLLQPQTNDGALSLEEIFNLKFKADMVVLSSCQGGAGKNVRGEGILAITRGFVYLGTPHIIYTLWSVNDKDAAKLMIRFYANMSQSKSYREALRLAKLSMLESAQTAWPRWWAGFTMMSKMR